jgi:hypothetical protein
MKSNAITAVGISLVDLPLTVEAHPIFRITRTEMESGASPTLARLAVAQVNAIGLTRGNYSKRAAVALPDPFHSFLPILVWPAFWPIMRAGVEPLRSEGPSSSGSGKLG